MFRELNKRSRCEECARTYRRRCPRRRGFGVGVIASAHFLLWEGYIRGSGEVVKGMVERLEVWVRGMEVAGIERRLTGVVWKVGGVGEVMAVQWKL